LLQHLVVFTKMDKMKSSNQERSAQVRLTKELVALGGPDPLFVSAKDGRGLGPILSVFEELGRNR
jgi:predicted GTPase